MEKQLYVEQLDVGMILSRPVRCRQHTVYKPGVSLSPRHIHRLRKLNVKEVFVKTEKIAA
ncbi:MAG: hypothetical protein ACLFN5_04255 [bacterium]